MRIGPWQVWLVQFDPQVASEQAGTRPAIVVGSPLMCDTVGRRLALVVPCTNTDRGLPWQPQITLDRPSVIMCEQVKTVARERLIRRLDHQVPQEVRDRVSRSLRTLLA